MVLQIEHDQRVHINMGMEYIYVQCVGAPDVENLCINQSQLLARVSAYLSINMCICILKTCVTSLVPAKLVLALLWVDDDEVLTLVSGRSWRSSWAVAVS